MLAKKKYIMLLLKTMTFVMATLCGIMRRNQTLLGLLLENLAVVFFPRGVLDMIRDNLPTCQR
jgi:hypothetical protein